jgi:hypothetical protein
MYFNGFSTAFHDERQLMSFWRIYARSYIGFALFRMAQCH